MIFKDKFIDLILAGKKTQTRRPNKGYYVVGKTYAIQPCRICKGIENYRIMMDDIWREVRDYEPERTNTKYMPISEEDAWAEGQYTPSAFEKAFKELYPKWDGKKRWAFKFHVVEVTNEN
jgi:hypothetical protein